MDREIKIPVISGIVIGASNTETQMKQTLDKVCACHEQYENIHSISIQSETLLHEGSATKKSDELMLKAIKYLQSKNLDVTISTPSNSYGKHKCIY